MAGFYVNADVARLVCLKPLCLGRASFAFRSRKIPTLCRSRQRSSPESGASGFRNSQTTASRSSSDTSMSCAKKPKQLPVPGSGSFAVDALSGSDLVRYRACATSKPSVGLCRTASPESKQAHHAPASIPVLLVSSSPGYEVGSALSVLPNVTKKQSCHEKGRPVRIYMIIRNGTFRNSICL